MKNKFLLIFTALCLAAILLSGCNLDKEPNNLSDDDKVVVMTIDENPVYYPEFRYFFLSYKQSFDGGDSSLWENSPEMFDSLKSAVIDSIKLNRVVLDMGEEDGLSLTAEEIKANVDDEIENLGDEYMPLLEEYHMTDSLFRYLQTAYATYEKIYNAYCTDGGKFTDISQAEALEYAHENNYIRAKHILISTAGLDDDAKAEKYAFAEQLLQRAKDGEDFDALIAEYGEDPGMKTYLDGYYFTTGAMVPEFESASYALEIDEISDIVETTHGYHIIKKLVVEGESLIDQVSSQIAIQKLDDYMMNKADLMNVEFSDDFDSYTIETVK